MTNPIEIIKDKLESLKEQYEHTCDLLKEYDAYTPDEYDAECNEATKMKAKIDILEEILEECNEEDI